MAFLLPPPNLVVYGIYLNTAGGLIEEARGAVIANNLANVRTPGFKRDLAVFRARGTSADEGRTFRHEVNPILERIGGGVLLEEVASVTDAGPLEASSNPFHVALEGEAGLFAVTDGSRTFYTRAGNFVRDRDGTLVTADGRYTVLGSEGEPIRVQADASEVVIDDQGHILVDGEARGAFRIAGDLRSGAFEKVGENLYRHRGAGEPTRPSGPVRVRQFFVENAAVNPVAEMTRMISSMRAYETNLQMIQVQDETLGRAVNDVGRVTA